jgi:glutamate dehydrogenase (NAD(P)+)
MEGIVGPDSDIPAPDVGTNARTMAWFMDTVSMHRGYSVPGVVTGKPLAIGGSVGRADATGQGVVFTIEDTATRAGIELRGARVAVQGFGNVGEATARLLHERGARIVAITDVAGGAFAPDGLNVPMLSRFVQEHGTIAAAPGTLPIENEELFGLDVDVLVLAALEGQITAENAGSVKARILAEAANGPVAPDADPILDRNGVIVIPDIVCNAGGVIVSYFEWAQNRAALAWTLDEVNDRLERQILAALAAVRERAAADEIPPRRAAHAIAVERVAEATQLRGLYPCSVPGARISGRLAGSSPRPGSGPAGRPVSVQVASGAADRAYGDAALREQLQEARAAVGPAVEPGGRDRPAPHAPNRSGSSNHGRMGCTRKHWFLVLSWPLPRAM